MNALFRMAYAFLFIAVFATSITVVGCGKQENGRSPTASKILRRMATTYADCRTYADSGAVTTIFRSEEGESSEIKPFKTAMVRPDQFRYEFSVDGNTRSQYIVWQKGKIVRNWWAARRLNSTDSLGMALAGATGVSSGSAHTIPALLMPQEVGGRLLTEVENARRGEDRMCGDHQCFTIEGKYADDPIIIWIDKESYLVRRIDETSTYDDFTADHTTTYDPVVNDEISPTLLEFRSQR